MPDSVSRHRIVLTEALASVAMQWLEQRAEVAACDSEAASFSDHMREADGLIVRTYTRVDERLLAQAPRLRVVGRAGAGVDNIDIAACRARGVEVVHTPDANTQSVVEYVLALLLPRLRPVTPLRKVVNQGTWAGLRAVPPGRELGSMTIGILGLGRIGQCLARAGVALGANVIYHDLVDIAPDRRHGASPVEQQALYEQADVLSIHVDGRRSNRHVVGKAQVDRLRPESVLVNTSRGFVVDATALAAFLRGHEGAQAIIDVHDPEPFGPDYPLLGLPNATLLPHLGARTKQAMENMSWVVRDVMAVLEGRPPRFPAPDDPPAPR